MATPVIEEVVESSTNTAGTTHTITYPTAISNQLWLKISDIGTTAATWTEPSGWTQLLDEGVANGLYIAWHWADGTEGASQSWTTSAATRSADVVYRISGAEHPNVIAPEIETTSTTTTPPVATPTGTKDFLYIVMIGSTGEQTDDDTYVTTFPTGYTDGQAEKTCGVAGTNLGGLIGSAGKRTTGTNGDTPGAFTVSEAGTHRSQTISVHPFISPLPDLVIPRTRA